MNEQQPHLEILSRNRVNRSHISIVVVAIPVIVLTGLVAYALLPFLWLIGYGVLALASIGFVYLVALLYLDIKRRALHAKVVHLGEYGAIDAEQWRMLPLALPAPVITEITDDEVVKRSKILNLRAKGRTLQEIVDELHIPYNQVQKICAAAVNLVIEK